ncbi:MAG TPA: type II toxin-antitoxin system PemK/MazF family toxin [Pseudomonadales bacterium]
MAKTLIWWPDPNAGDIVWCHFPQVPGNPGPKPRPALIIAVDDSNPKAIHVQVAYGTSQKTNRLYAGEFLIAKQHNADAYRLAGLSYDTKFDLGKIVQLPYNSLWFAIAPRASASPHLGTLHPSLMPALTAAYKAANK